MIRMFAVIALLLAAPVALAAEDAAGARVPLEAYLKAQATGDGQLIRDAFWPEGHLVFIREGKISTLSVEEFAARFTGKPSPTAAQTKRTIERVEVAGDAGVAVLTLDGPTHRITDFITLLKRDGAWRIIHKSFHAQPKAGATAK